MSKKDLLDSMTCDELCFIKTTKKSKQKIQDKIDDTGCFCGSEEEW